MKATQKGKRLKVVTIGGGTGHSVLLEGLKNHPIQLTAIVSMADDGGSTGELRDELGVLPPGDVRKCLVALAGASEELRTLFQYRFENGGASGHTLGNLFISALQKTSGSFSGAVAAAGKILKVYGRVVPVSEDDMRLMVTLKDGSILRGEHYLNDNELVREKGVESVALEGKAVATQSSLDAIENADAIIIGPGGLYDSLLPPLLVEGISKAIKESSAKLIYVGNLTNKKGQTEHFDLHDYAESLHKHLAGRKIDTIIFSNSVPNKDLLRNYEEQEGGDALVVYTEKKGMPYDIHAVDVLANGAPETDAADAIAKSRSLIRHDSMKLASVIMECIQIKEYE